MATINTRRVALGALAGGFVWSVWSTIVNVVILGASYQAAGQSGHLLLQPRYKLFLLYWFITVFLVSYVLAWLYASVRSTQGAGPRTALLLGVVVGFAISFPGNLVAATWAPFDRMLPLGWMLDQWLGAILATLVAGWLYKD